MADPLYAARTLLRAAAANAFLVLTSLNATAAPILITDANVITIGFQLPGVPTSHPDVLTLGFCCSGIAGGRQTPTAQASLYNNGSLLGVSTLSPTAPIGLGWQSSSSAYSVTYPGAVPASLTTIDFSSILNGSINGTIKYQPGAGTSFTIDPLATSGGLNSIVLTLGTGQTNGLTYVIREQPTITSVSISGGSPRPASFEQTVDPCFIQFFCAQQYHETFNGTSLTISLSLGINGVASDELKATWVNGIESFWGSQTYGERFSIADGLNKYPIYFDVDFVEGGLPSDFTFDLVDGIGRTETSTWYTTLEGWGNDFQDEAAAHEFGHYLGLYDEYKTGTLDPLLGGDFGFGWRCDGSKLLTDSSNSECDGLMGDLRRGTVERYYTEILNDFADFTGHQVVLAKSPLPPPSPSSSLFLDNIGEGALGASTGRTIPEPATLWLVLSSTMILSCSRLGFRLRLYLYSVRVLRYCRVRRYPADSLS